jgi:RNA polymerase sigma factor (sigma-70 family)
VDRVFATTHWSLVLQAGASDTTHARDALAQLCEAYWYPLYAFARRRGYSSQDAQDLTQEFFARLLAGHWLAQADRERGRFRSFLLTAFKHFLANEWNKARTLKRGGGVSIVSLNATSGEERYAREPLTDAPAETTFDRQWALSVLDTVLAQLEAEYQRENNGDLFAALKDSLTADRGAQRYADLAARLGRSEGAVGVAVHRLRQRYRKLLRSEVAKTVAEPNEVDEELRHLFHVLTND